MCEESVNRKYLSLQIVNLLNCYWSILCHNSPLHCDYL